MLKFYQYLVFQNEEDFNQNAEQQGDCYIVDHHVLGYKPDRFPAFFVKQCSFDNHSMGWIAKCGSKQVLNAIEKEMHALNSLKAEIEHLMGE